MNFTELFKTVYNPAAFKTLGEQITGPSATFDAQLSYDTMYLLTPGFPAALAVGYIIMVFGGQAVMTNRTPFNMKSLVTVWNSLLAAFSIAGAFYTVPYALEKLTNGASGISSESFMSYLCNPGEGLYDGVPGYWVFVFILSKTPELLDTFFLVFQKKPVIFLHWYHHFTVMLFSWQAWILGSTAGLYYAAMNFSVHAIMYSYYFLMSFKIGRTIVKPLAPFITSLQIIQMVGGIIISTYCFLALAAKDVKCAPLDKLNVQLGMGMYVSYFILFSMLFKKMYFGKKKKDGRSSITKSVETKTTRSASQRK